MVGKLFSFKTADDSRLCHKCGAEMGFKDTSIADTTNVLESTDAELLAKYSNSSEQASVEMGTGTFKTIEGIRAYLKANNDTTSGGDIKNFEALLDSLQPDEVIHIPFTGALVIQVDGEDSEVNTAFAFTNTRLIYKRNAGILSTLGGHGDQFGTMPLTDVYGASSHNNIIMGSLMIDTIRDTIEIKHNKEFCAKMVEIIEDHLEKHKQSAVQVAQVDVTEELRKYKQLETDGIITNEEFEAKKKELLSI